MVHHLQTICKQEVSSLPVLVQELWVHILEVTSIHILINVYFISELNLSLWSWLSYSLFNMIPGNCYSLLMILKWCQWRKSSSKKWRMTVSEWGVWCNMLLLMFFFRCTPYTRRPSSVKLSLWQAMEAHWVVRHQDFHIFWTFSSQMAVRFSVLCAGCPFSTGRFPVLISVRGWVDHRGP
jgi:hypothetical protein